MRLIDVKAKKLGFYGGKRRYPNEAFQVKENLFSDAWMEKPEKEKPKAKPGPKPKTKAKKPDVEKASLLESDIGLTESDLLPSGDGSAEVESL